MLEEISKSNGWLVFRCEKCYNEPPENFLNIRHIKEVLSRLTSLENQIHNLNEKVASDVVGQLFDIKNDIINCTTKIAKLENETNTKILMLEKENNYLHKQMNRSDKIIRGIPEFGISNESIISVVINIGKKYINSLDDRDIQFCTFINKRRAVLLKLNNINKRDSIMMQYRAELKNKDSTYLKISDIMETDINSRIYLDDNYTPLESKLRYVCRDLKRNNVINRYKIMFKKDYQVIVFLKDGIEKVIPKEKMLLYATKNISKEELFNWS